MSCFFCNSITHLSHNCDVYISKQQRKQIVKLKNHCLKCLAPPNAAHTVCTICDSNYKCYICFSKSHHSVFCPDLVTVTNMFPPNIDSDLLSRFMKVLNLEETYFVTLTYPLCFDAVNLEPLKVYFQKNSYFSSNNDYANYDLVVVDEAYVRHFRGFTTNRPRQLFEPTVAEFRLQQLEISCSHMFTQEALQLLSLKTKAFRSQYVQFHSNLNFVDIIKKAPNLEILDLRQTNVEINSSWSDILLKYSSENNFKCIHLQIPDLNFNMDSLAALMKKKSTKNFTFYFYIVVSNEEKFCKVETFEVANQKLSKYFIPITRQSHKCFRIIYTNDPTYKNCLGYRDYISRK